MFSTAPGCEFVKSVVVVPSSCPAEQPLDSGKSICVTIPSPETLPALAPWCLLRCLRLPPPLFRGDQQNAVPCTGAVEIQGVCDISGYQDLYRVSVFGWQWRGFGRLCVESPVHLFIQKAVKVEWVKNVPAQQEIGWQDGLALRVGTPSSFTIDRVFESSTHRAAALIEFLLLRFGLLGAILSFFRRFNPNNPTFTLSIVNWGNGFLSCSSDVSLSASSPASLRRFITVVFPDGWGALLSFLVSSEYSWEVDMLAPHKVKQFLCQMTSLSCFRLMLEETYI